MADSRYPLFRWLAKVGITAIGVRLTAIGRTRQSLLSALFQPIEVLVQARAKLFGQLRSRIAGGLRDAVVFAVFLFIDAAADQRQSRIVRRTAPSATRVRSAAAPTFRVDAFRFQQQLDRFRLGRDRGGAGVRSSENRLRIEHDHGHLSEQSDLFAKFLFAVFEQSNAIDDVLKSLAELLLRVSKLVGLLGVFVGFDRRFGLLGDTSFFSQIHFTFEDLQNFQNDGGRQTAARFAAGSGAPFGRIDQILRPAVHRIGPVLGLSDRQAVLFLEVITQ